MDDRQKFVARNYQLSKNFTLLEAINSQEHPELVVFPSYAVIEKLQLFYTYILQPIRNHFGAIQVLSGYRNARLNKAVGGVGNSVHQIFYADTYVGVAADIQPMDKSVDIVDMHSWIYKNIAIKCVILYRDPEVTSTKFLHVDTGTFRKSKVSLEKVADDTYINWDDKGRIS